ncbi:MAG: hypothetical protein ACTSQ8_07835 [Candidatus Helarchaeota archaeon]
MSNMEKKLNKLEKKAKAKAEAEEEKRKNGVIATNIKKHKKIIIYYLGVFLVNVAVRAANYLSMIYPDSPIGVFLNGVTSDSVLFITFIAPWIFGGREAISLEQQKTKRVKEEREKIGKELSRIKEEKEGLRITNQLQAQLLQENGFKPYVYESPYGGVKKE